MEYSKKENIIKVVNSSLDRAEELWKNTLDKNKIIATAKETETNIPGHNILARININQIVFLLLCLI
jgi:hypothetical protein